MYYLPHEENNHLDKNLAIFNINTPSYFTRSKRRNEFCWKSRSQSESVFTLAVTWKEWLKIWSNRFLIFWDFRSVFKTHLNIYDKTSWENGERLLVVNYFCKKLSRGCFARFLICLWTLSWLTVDQKEKFYHMPGLIRTFMRKLICYAYS